ncbi:MAG: GNAT family N-acetyltransferase [Calditrichaeota bacterium]|nr:MAG: GNAT family N-acetyltransferase [Calditrichota bacterium]
MLKITDKISEHLSAVRLLFKEYAEWMDHDLCFEGFADELENLPGEYAPPDGFLLLAFIDETPVGCIALRRFDEETCEMKRLWVNDKYRNLKIGVRLIEEFLLRAAKLDYRHVRLETTPKMTKAIDLYRSFKFQIVSDSEKIIVMFKKID